MLNSVKKGLGYRDIIYNIRNELLTSAKLGVAETG